MKSTLKLHQQIKILEAQIEIEKTAFHTALGLKIASFRKSHKMTQATLAERMGSERTTITNIELGNQKMSIDHLIGFCEVFSINANELLSTNTDTNKQE